MSTSYAVVCVKEKTPTAMFIQLSSAQAPAGRVTFFVTTYGTQTHAFLVMQTVIPAANSPPTEFYTLSLHDALPILGVNVGETGDVKAGESKTLALTLAPGHYALVCNLPGH